MKILSLLLIGVSVTFAQLIAPKAVLKITEYNFGDIKQGEIVKYGFMIANNGGDLLKIAEVRASCGCTAAKPEKSELKPGELTSIGVTFNSEGRTGEQHKYIYVTTNDPNNKDITLKIYGNILTSEKFEISKRTPKIFLPEEKYDFGKVKEGDTVTHLFKIINRGKAVLDIKDVKTSCSCTAALVSENKINPGKEATVKIDFDSKNRVGKVSRTITIVSNDSEEPNKIITISAEVSKAGK